MVFEVQLYRPKPFQSAGSDRAFLLFNRQWRPIQPYDNRMIFNPHDRSHPCPVCGYLHLCTLFAKIRRDRPIFTHREFFMYEKFFKRALDILLSLIALIMLFPILLVFTVIGAILMRGNPFFLQPRPGRIDPKTGKEKIFLLIKFRSMTDKRDAHGNLLPDGERLNKYGAWLRSSSCDELPELVNILIGDMSLVGPRPQLVRDMVFMTDAQRVRHTVLPGLTGLAQCNGRNNMSWERKFAYDLKYIQNITLWGDIKILAKTAVKVFQKEGITEDGCATALDYGDYLLEKELVNFETYLQRQNEAIDLVKELQ